MLGTVNPQLVVTSPQDPVVYRGRSNIVQSLLTMYNGRRYVALDFADVNRMVLILLAPEGQMVFDSSLTAGVITWGTGGLITFDLTAYALPVGIYDAQLVVYDSQHISGQVIIDGQQDSKLLIDVREVFTAGMTPPPLPTGGESNVRVAGEAMSALRAVYELGGRVFLLDQLDSTHMELFIGITVSAAVEGADVIIQRSGTIDDANWTWTVGLVFLGSQGRLTQLVPTTGWELVLGSAPTATRLNLDFDEPVLLAQEQ